MIGKNNMCTQINHCDHNLRELIPSNQTIYQNSEMIPGNRTWFIFDRNEFRINGSCKTIETRKM